MKLRVRRVFGMPGLILLFALILPIFFLSCSSDGPTPPDPEPVQAEVDDYMVTLPSWTEFSPPLAPIDEDLTDTDETLDLLDGTTYLCSTTHCSIQDTPEEIVTHGAAESVLWLGSLIQGDSYLGGVGTMEELPIRQRAPLKIGIDVLSSDSERTVANPDAVSVREAIGELVDSAMANGHSGGGGIIYHESTFHSMDQAMIKMKVSAKFIGASARARMEVSRETDERTVMAYFKQVMFKTYVVLPQVPSDMFSNEFTAEVMADQIALDRIGPTNLPVFVSEITWGRMMMLTMTSSHSEKEMKAALQAKKAGIGSVSISGELQQVIDESEIRVAALGGTDTSVLALIQSGDLGDFFSESAPLDTAVPLAYKLCNLANNSLATVGETTEYDRAECSAVAVQYFDTEIEFQNAILTMGGEYYDFRTTESSMTLADGIDSEPGDNDSLGDEIVFRGVNTGLPFDFTFEAKYPDPDVADRGLVWEDEEGSQHPSWQIGSISIGDIDNQPDDDWYLRANAVADTCEIIGLGLWLLDNTASEGEGLFVFGGTADNVLLESFLSGLPDVNDAGEFMGIISSVPLKYLEFNEDSGQDDTFVKDFFFGIRDKE